MKTLGLEFSQTQVIKDTAAAVDRLRRLTGVRQRGPELQLAEPTRPFGRFVNRQGIHSKL